MHVLCMCHLVPCSAAPWIAEAGTACDPFCIKCMGDDYKRTMEFATETNTLAYALEELDLGDSASLYEEAYDLLDSLMSMVQAAIEETDERREAKARQLQQQRKSWTES